MKKPSRLAIRIYVVVLLQFLVVAAALEIGRRATRPQHLGEKEAQYVADGLARVYDDPVALDTELKRAAETLRTTLEVQDGEGRVVARAESSDPRHHPSPHHPPAPHHPPPPPPPHLGPDHPPPPHPRGHVPIPLSKGRTATLVYDDRPPGPPPPGPLSPGGVALVLGVVGVFSVFVARSLTRPLERLGATARAFGGGNLEARAKMDRKDEIGDVARAFDDMADRVERLLLAERELLANVSHELRTPLARIRVALDLANEAEPKVAVESLGEIAEDLAELERIVDDVLAAARLAHKGTGTEIPLRKEAIATRALLDKAIAKFRALHPERALAVKVDDDLPDLVGDPVLVRRVLDNLLDNANKYSKTPSDSIDLTASEEDGMLLVEVRDRGVGIAKEDLERIFEPFFRADRSRTRATGGLGLGLALARRVVDAHGGTIAFTSEVGVGTTARVRLPLAQHFETSSTRTL